MAASMATSLHHGCSWAGAFQLTGGTLQEAGERREIDAAVAGHDEHAGPRALVEAAVICPHIRHHVAAQIFQMNVYDATAEALDEGIPKQNSFMAKRWTRDRRSVGMCLLKRSRTSARKRTDGMMKSR